MLHAAGKLTCWKEVRYGDTRVVFICHVKLRVAFPLFKFLMQQPNSALHDAAERGDLGKVVESLRSGQDINAGGKYNRTALHITAKTGNTRLVEYLLHNGIDINLKNAHGFSAAYVAAVANKVEALQAITGSPGVDVDAEDLGGMTPLIAATCNGCCVEVIQCLLDAGASPRHRDSIGRCALDWAREKRGDEAVLKLLQCYKEKQSITC